MKRWLSYILMAVLCGLYLSSCAKDEEVAKATDGGKVPVRLTLAFSNFGGRAASEPGDLDYTTVEQSAMTADDVYVLVVDANDNFLYQVQDLKLGNPVEGDNYYTRQLEGTMLRTVGGEQVKLVVLANLKDNKIASYTTGAAIRNFLETKKGSNIAKVYKELVYHYGGSTIPWKLAERAIPMWGSSNLTAVPGTGVDLACNLYRAVAKVGIWVNMQDGYQGFTITKIIVNNANDKGYCVSTETPNPVETVQYIYPSIPAGAQNQTITYDGLQVTTAYENEIYLPETVNTTGGNEISLTVHYTYHNKAKVGTIKFRTNGDGDIFDVIRNHSYLFNIKLSTIEIDAELQYQVMDWTEVDNGELDFGDGGGDVRQDALLLHALTHHTGHEFREQHSGLRRPEELLHSIAARALHLDVKALELTLEGVQSLQRGALVVLAGVQSFQRLCKAAATLTVHTLFQFQIFIMISHILSPSLQHNGHGFSSGIHLYGKMALAAVGNNLHAAAAVRCQRVPTSSRRGSPGVAYRHHAPHSHRAGFAVSGHGQHHTLKAVIVRAFGNCSAAADLHHLPRGHTVAGKGGGPLADALIRNVHAISSLILCLSHQTRNTASSSRLVSACCRSCGATGNFFAIWAS